LGHSHQQVRLEAQYELMTRPVQERVEALQGIALKSESRLARIHAIWALGVNGGPTNLFTKLSHDDDAEVRYQVIRTIGRQPAVQGLVSLTKSPNDLFNVWTTAKGADKVKYDTPPVRMGVALALRRMESGKLSTFLTDGDPRIAAEAARAIHDINIADAMAD